ncbi:unnamed protein product [Caenorhabditis bovis]|uniref:Profilin n=1 Tax=Caenorhabditis bovis TaxID=2654633 RepID=A0A8S1EM48_9PELO|nr:unnamed protein product [Caenorhabditis bovis]
MSWDSIINGNLLGTGFVSKAAICGFDGSIWAKSANFNISAEEAVNAGKAFSNKEALLGTGMRLEGQKYVVLNVDDERVIGKQGSAAVIISIYEGGLQPEQCSKCTGALADYFKKINY